MDERLRVEGLGFGVVGKKVLELLGRGLRGQGFRVRVTGPRLI